ncbi:MAG: alpha/beta hydrolase [Candidatus Competibacteraceae bacterium]|nr:alpha/beta hydrolase [Candidatus Competibacteraceae bacterium]MBK7983077.1 alpha/beta hydrolase [Candidatus Competibacteraceae bacterium]MBK8898375.1 alpha/beta hydrolase [Candidatus Competibacteraceae bacterium]MBK8962180.1 alpha/beta hydrolase [Candidatus Competibacteraceae bacterium]MBK9951395.1 alpha/beta hydrolase [Candidatus Competibacteraceae bacterium]
MPVARLAGVGLHYLQFPCRLENVPPPCGDLVLVHGLAANLGFWHLGIVRPLSQLCSLTAYDLRGHGRSDIPAQGYSPQVLVHDLARLLDYLKLERVHLLAHSYGGAVALLFAVLFPERVISLILADVRLRTVQPHLRLRDWPHWPHWRPRFEQAGIVLDDDAPESGYQLLVEMARSHLHNPAAGEHLPRVFGLTGNPSRRGGTAHRWLHLQESTSIRQEYLSHDDLTPARLATLRQPILGVYGEQSTTVRSGSALRRLCPNYRLRLVPNAGHFFPLSKPRRLVRPTLRFLAAQANLAPAATDLPELQHDDAESDSLLASF